MQKTADSSSGLFDRLCNFKIGPVPLPLYICFAIIIFLASYYGKLPKDMIGGFAVMLVMGILLGDMGLRIPILKDIGGPAILSIFIPSVLVYYSLLDGPAKEAIIHFTAGKNGGANFLYFYIACLVTGSILGMLREVLIQGFLRMFVPLILGTLASCIVGTAVGTLLGHGTFETFFYIVVPIISGGVGEGILPLSAGYAEIQGTDPGRFIAMVAPAAMLGNVTAIICAGILKRYAIKNPHQTGNGKLVRVGDDNLNLKQEEEPVDVTILGMGLLTACCFYLFGMLINIFIPIPAPIIMILSAAIAKATGIMPRIAEKAAYQFYLFVSKNLTWALLVGVGVCFTPWQDVVAVIQPSYIITVMSTVLAMVATGFFSAKFLNMYPVEAALVTGCHSGLGGTGDVAILSAAGRMELMPFAQISTRIGGAAVVVAAVILMRVFYAG
ncbi:2-hydroxycarboxylate transporter family protein [Desulfovibrio falkowii]|uniref:2-hydroxycarboxylate transporter family protein n=1 Tax=Desulfovibrio sp. WGS1351 TaxID=3366814 RepID=UPI00372D6FAE